MKKFKFILSLFFIAILVLFVSLNIKNKSTKLSDTYLVKELMYDVNNDNLADKIELYGKKNNVDDNEFLSFELIVTDGDSQLKRKFSPNFLKGANPSISLHEFTGDNMPEVFISAEADGFLLTSIASLNENIIKPVFQENHNQGVQLNLSFGENFSLNGSFADSTKLAINLEHIKPALISYGIYTEDGKYKEKDTPSITPYSSLIPMDLEGDGIYELCGTQTIKTKNSNLPLCNLISVHKYKDGFKVTDIKYTR